MSDYHLIYLMELSRLINSIREPQTILMAKLSRELKAQNIAITDLSIGEPDFDTPSHIKEAAITAINDGWTKYPPVAGYPDLKQAICDKLKRDNNLDYTSDQIVVSTGAKQSLSNLFECLVSEGDEVIIPTPYWVTYAAQVQIAGGKSVFIHCGLEDQFKLTPAKLEAAITPKTKVLVYSSPCNPSGAVYSAAELSALKDVLIQYPEITIISDEIYEFINYKGKHHSMADFPEIKDRVAIVNGFSKGYAMTGWRLGYMAASAELSKACEKMQAQTTSGANSIAQRAAIEALVGDQTPTLDMLAAYTERMEYFVTALQNIKGFKVAKPEGAFYAFVDISYYFGKELGGKVIQNSEEFAMYVLQQVHVTGVPGIAFGADDCIRFSFATSMDNLKEAIAKLQQVFN